MPKNKEINYNKIRIFLLIVLLLLIIALIIVLPKNKNQVQKLAHIESVLNLDLSGNTINIGEIAGNVPNTPKLGAGMIPIKWVDSAWQITTTNDTEWYDYSIGKMATVMLSDGHYVSELRYNMGSHEVVPEDINDLPQVSTEQLGTIYVWIPRYSYYKEDIKYLKDNSFLTTSDYQMPNCFYYKQNEMPELSFTGIWVEMNTQSSTANTTSKVNQMKIEDNNYGLIKNELVEAISAGGKKAVTNLQEQMKANKQQVQDVENSNRTMIRIMNTNVNSPIMAEAKVSKKLITVTVTYSENEITKIIRLDTGDVINSTLTPKIGTTTVEADGTYEFAIIDLLGNIRTVTARVGSGEPNLVGFRVDTTYLVTYVVDEEGNFTNTYTNTPIEDILKPGYITDDNNALVEGSIDHVKVSNLPGTWYNYSNRIWANIVTRNNANEAYFVWIPRYVYQLDNNTQTSTVKIVTTENEDEEGNVVDLSKWTLSQAFTWWDEDNNAVPLSGYWMSKYELTAAVSMGINANVVGGINKVKVNNISNTSGLGSITYDLYLYDGSYNTKAMQSKVKPGDELFVAKNVTTYIFDDLAETNYYVRIVLNSGGVYRGERWFPVAVIEEQPVSEMPDVTGYRINTTYLVTYTTGGSVTQVTDKIMLQDVLDLDKCEIDENTNTLISGTVDEQKLKAKFTQENEVWYDYSKQIWANIVVRNAGSVSYFTWIPRYIYKLDTVQQMSEIQFVGRDVLKADVPSGWTLSEAFTWWDENNAEVPLAGYWMSKYELAAQTTFNITASVIGGGNDLRIYGVQDGSGLGFKYRFYLYEKDNCPKEYFAEPQASPTGKNADGSWDCSPKELQFVRYSQNVTADIYYGLNAGFYNLRIAAYDSNGYYRGEKWFNNIEVVERGTPNDIIEVDLTGFRTDTTYLVLYKNINGVVSASRENVKLADVIYTNDEGTFIDKTKLQAVLQENEFWYDYDSQIWANVVTKNNSKTAYFVWIPRYVYKLDGNRQETEIKFIRKDDSVPKGWTLSEAFTWWNENNEAVPIRGYWMSKYELSS